MAFCRSAGSGPMTSTPETAIGLGNHLHTDLGITPGNDVADGATKPPLAQLGFCLHLCGNAKAIEHLGEMDAARATARGVRVSDRLGRKQRALQGFR